MDKGVWTGGLPVTNSETDEEFENNRIDSKKEPKRLL